MGAPDRPTAEPPPATLRLISPHLDDGALSAGALLADRPGAVVTTVFAGDAPIPFHDRLTDWDRAAGMETGLDPVATRRAEDRAALRLLGATPHWLGFVDTQYRMPPSIEAVAAALADELRDAAHVVAPLGIWHRDHVLVADACLLVFRDLHRKGALTPCWWLYADVPYRALEEGACTHRRLSELAGGGLDLAPVQPGDDPDGRRAVRKQQALACYPSQLRALRSDARLGVDDAARPEQFWRLRPTPA